MADISQKVFSVRHGQEERHTQELAERLQLPYADLTAYPFAEDVFEIIPFKQITEKKIIPFLKVSNTVKIGVVDPRDSGVIDYLQTLSKSENIKFTLVLISKTSFYYGISVYNQAKAKQKEDQKQQGESLKDEGTLSDRIKNLSDVAKTAAAVNTTKIFDVLMVGAIRTLASDIHLEPRESDFMVRYRIDGILQNVVSLPNGNYHGLISRLKFLAKLKLDKSDEPQDGRFSITIEGQRIDLRVATMPSAYGEAVVIRILGHDRSMQKLGSLGFRPEAVAVIKQAISRPHGMILNSGPTGSGKTTTMYAILLEIRKPGIKIITLEDPIEYRIEEVEQSQIDPEGNYTFAEGLRGALRADPDVIMVGEIRDSETAQIGIQAALTGHLLLSTIHANSAPAVFPRLLDIGVKPFLLSGSLNLVMAQRLIRLICDRCREEYQPPEPIWLELKHSLLLLKDCLNIDLMRQLEQPAKLFRGRGCEKCNQTGFSGRQAIVETLVPNDEIDGLIARQASQSEFAQAATRQGMITMEQDGLIKVLEGQTTVDEVWRVTRDY